MNGRYWAQNFNCQENEIEISNYSNRDEFKEVIDIDKAVDCFRKPYLW